MRAFTCVKPATFAGVKYMPGETVPEDAIAPDRIDAVIRLGLVTETAPAPAGAAVINDGIQIEPGSEEFATLHPVVIDIPIVGEDGAAEHLTITDVGVSLAVSVLQMTVEAVTEQVEAIIDVPTLVMIRACDSRKTVKKAVTARLEEIAAQEAAREGQETPGEGQETPGEGQENTSESHEENSGGGQGTGAEGAE